MDGPRLEPIALDDLERAIGGSRTAVIGSNWAIDALLAAHVGGDAGAATGGWLGMASTGDSIQDLYSSGQAHEAQDAPMYLDAGDFDLDNDLYDDDPYRDPYRR